MSSPQQGIIYVASGARSYLGELTTSLASLRRIEPEIPITVITDFKIPARFRCQVQAPEPAANPFQLKVYSLAESPYERTLFLDTDITLRGPLSPLFAMLDAHDFAAANSHLADWTVRPPRFLAMVQPGDYNTGVLLWKKSPPAQQLLAAWAAAVRAQDPADMWAGHNCDQFHFNKLVKEGALGEHGVAFGELDNVVYNCRGTMLDAVRAAGRERDVRIFHHRTRTMKLMKLVYSVTDPATFTEIAKKLLKRPH